MCSGGCNKNHMNERVSDTSHWCSEQEGFFLSEKVLGSQTWQICKNMLKLVPVQAAGMESVLLSCEAPCTSRLGCLVYLIADWPFCVLFIYRRDLIVLHLCNSPIVCVRQKLKSLSHPHNIVWALSPSHLQKHSLKMYTVCSLRAIQ